MAKKRLNWKLLPRDFVIEVEESKGVRSLRHLCEVIVDEHGDTIAWAYPEGRSSKTVSAGENPVMFRKAWLRCPAQLFVVMNSAAVELDKEGFVMYANRLEGGKAVAVHHWWAKPEYSIKMHNKVGA